MKNVRRYVALVIIMCLVSSFTFPASASEVKTNALDGMDRYFTLTQNGTISFEGQKIADKMYPGLFKPIIIRNKEMFFFYSFFA